MTNTERTYTPRPTANIARARQHVDELEGLIGSAPELEPNAVRLVALVRDMLTDAEDAVDVDLAVRIFVAARNNLRTLAAEVGKQFCGNCSAIIPTGYLHPAGSLCDGCEDSLADAESRTHP